MVQVNSQTISLFFGLNFYLKPGLKNFNKEISHTSKKGVNVSWLWGEPKKKTSYGIRAEKKAEDYLKKRFKVVSMGRTLQRAPASHGPADWEVIDSNGKIIALIQVKSSKYKGGARLSAKEREKLINTAKNYHTRAFLTTYERGHYTTKQLYPIKQ